MFPGQLGELRVSKPKVSFQNGCTYEGQWVGNKKDGEGVQTWSDGAKYEGEWKMGERHGLGVFTWPDGSTYHGQWMQNRKTGLGHKVYADGQMYLGLFQDDKWQGQSMAWLSIQIDSSTMENSLKAKDTARGSLSTQMELFTQGNSSTVKEKGKV